MKSKIRFLEDDKVQTEIYPIRVYEVDPSLRLTIRSICNFIQDAPAEQVFSWGLAVPQLLERNLTWMLSRLLIRMESYPSRKQGFIVQTWPSGIHKLFALRDYRFFNGEKKFIGAAITAWLLIDTKFRKPVRPNSLFDKEDRIYPEHGLDWIPEALPSLAEEQQSAEVLIRRSDLDMNDHVNASNYFDWLLESMPVEMPARVFLKEMEVNFLAEAVYGDRLTSRTGLTAEGPQTHEYLHSLDAADGRQAARGRTLWESSDG